MTILNLDAVSPVTEKPARDPDPTPWWSYVAGILAFAFAAAIVVAPTVITEAVVNHYYNHYLQETHPVNATITSVTPDGKSETLTPAEGEGSTLITRSHDPYDTIGKTTSVRVLSDGHFIDPPPGTLLERVFIGLVLVALTGLVIAVMVFAT